MPRRAASGSAPTTRRSAAPRCAVTDGAQSLISSSYIRSALLAGLVAAPSAAAAFPDGAPWEAAADPEGCHRCHFDAELVEDSAAVEISGLPERVEAGVLYRLTLALRDDAMTTAGFLITASRDGEPAGRFAAVDQRTAVQGPQARSTTAGTALGKSGLGEWSLEWIAPAEIENVISFDVWANASNDDESPFGDATHRRVWRIPAAARAQP